MTLQEFAETSNMELTATISRFGGNEGMLVRFLKKFGQDKTYEELVTAVGQEDYSTVERAAHTLKGVAANLGLEDIRFRSDLIVGAVRSGQYDKIPAFFQELKDGYEQTVENLDHLDV
jgi:HPt (histidine-containing phosphotransfer) domain-containing protein